MSEYDSWASVYDAWASDMTEDVAHYVSLAREADGPIVELMVGSGRVAIEVVRETGKSVLGIDSSPAMLEVARERAAGLPLELRLGDEGGVGRPHRGRRARGRSAVWLVRPEAVRRRVARVRLRHPQAVGVGSPEPTKRRCRLCRRLRSKH